MARQVMTAKWLEGLKPDGTRQEIPDGGSRGLYLYVLPSGTRSWYFRYKNAAGKQCRVPLGLYPDLSLADARAKADAERVRVRAGADPAAERVAEEQRKRDAADHAKAEAARREKGEHVEGRDPFGIVWARFAATYLKTKVKPGTVAKWTGIYKRVLAPVWDAKPLNEITADDVTALVWSLRKTPHAADSARILCRVIFDWCINAKAEDTGKPQRLITVNPATDVAKMVEKDDSEDDEGRTLSDAEIKALWIATEDSPQFGNAVRLLLLTGTRRNEVAQAVWDEFDLAAGTWKIPGVRTKNGKTHTVFLSPEALAVVAAVPKIDGAEYLFPSAKGDTPVSGFSKHKIALDKASGVTGWKLHDLRKTFATGLARLEISQTVTARCLNHSSEGKQTALDRIYNKHDFAPQTAKAWQAWGRHVAAVVSDAPSNVVPLVPMQGETVPA